MPAKVLIVDDDARNIFALNAMLRSRSYVCITATSAAEGITLLKENDDIGVVLMDMMMPDMDGYEAVPKIRAAYNIPVIAVTAQAMPGDKEKCLDAGAVAYLSKPIDVDKLTILLNEYI